MRNTEKMNDKNLEIAIDREYMKFAFGKTAALRTKAWNRMKALTAQRSAAKIREMEEKQGLMP